MGRPAKILPVFNLLRLVEITYIFETLIVNIIFCLLWFVMKAIVNEIFVKSKIFS